MIWRRRTSLINPRLQIWMGLETLMVVFGFLTVCALLLFVPPMNSLFGDPNDSALVFQAFMRVVFMKWPLVILSCAILVAIGVLMSHRLAGPMYGLNKTFIDWQKGNRSARVHFRKYDYLLPAKEPINSLLEGQENYMKAVQELALKLQQETSTEKVREIAKQLMNLGKTEAK